MISSPCYLVPSRLSGTSCDIPGTSLESTSSSPLEIVIRESRLHLEATVKDCTPHAALAGECVAMTITLHNLGGEDIERLWLVHLDSDVIDTELAIERICQSQRPTLAGTITYLETGGEPLPDLLSQVSNPFYSPIEISLRKAVNHEVMSSNISFDLPIGVHISLPTLHDLKLLFVYKGVRNSVSHEPSD